MWHRHVTFVFILSPILEALFSDALFPCLTGGEFDYYTSRDITLTYISSISLFQTVDASALMKAFHQSLHRSICYAPKHQEQHFRQSIGPLGLQQRH
jgi:hypothetical protein